MPRMTTARRPPLATIALVGLVLVLIRGASVGSGTRAIEPGVWQTGRPLAIATRQGQARFTVPTPVSGSRTLVIVSALSRGAGPYPIRVAARSIDPGTLGAPAIEPDGPRHAPGIVSRSLPVLSEPVKTLPPKARTFHLMVRDGDVASVSNYLAVEGHLRAVGHRVQVYVDLKDAGAVGPEVLRDLVATFDDQVFPVAARELGQARDVDGDGRFTVLMSSWLTRLAGGRHAVDGFVRGADLDLSLDAPFSNHCDMMYLSTALASGPHLRTVLAHEYTHAVTFSAKSLATPNLRTSGPEEEGWLDEALAHLVEDLHGFSRSNLDYRVSAFLSRPDRYRLVVEDYYAADLFRSHGNRGGTYLFLRWCVDRFGPGLIRSLIQSDRLGVANLEAATGWTFADLYRSWSVALFETGFDPSSASRAPLQSIDVRAPFDDWDLAGPRTFPVAPDGPEMAWATAGTASRYLIVGASRQGAVEVTVNAPAEANLQVTALALPDDLAEPEIQVKAVHVPDGEACLRVDLHERNGTAMRLAALAWEPLVPGPNPHAPGFRRAGLDMLGIADSFGTSALPAHGRLFSKLIAASGGLDDLREPLIIKAVGTDSHGRRVAAWAEVQVDDEGAADR